MPTTNSNSLFNAIIESASYTEIDLKKVNFEKLSNLPLVVKVNEIAACFRISPAMVRHLIEEGDLGSGSVFKLSHYRDLDAIDISLGSRRHYRIWKQSLLDYVKRKAAAK